MAARNHSVYQRKGKRLLDIALATLLLITLAPLLLLVAVIVQLALRRPIFFIDQRGGRHAIPFGCLKFRTLTTAQDTNGNPLPDDLRRTSVGDWLRATSLDELPQLWNVLRGDMSLVGPRPLTVDYLDRYSPQQQRRHDVRPGITGWAQINGRTSISWERKFELDAWYVEHVSFWLDAKILLLTLWQHLPLSHAHDTEPKSEVEFVGGETRQT